MPPHCLASDDRTTQPNSRHWGDPTPKSKVLSHYYDYYPKHLFLLWFQSVSYKKEELSERGEGGCRWMCYVMKQTACRCEGWRGRAAASLSRSIARSRHITQICLLFLRESVSKQTGEKAKSSPQTHMPRHKGVHIRTHKH